MHESSDSQLFRTITGIQLGTGSFNKSKFAMTFLTILGVTEILFSFRLVLEKRYPSHHDYRLQANNFALSDAEDNNSGPLNREGIADLPLWRTLLAIRQYSGEQSFWEVIDYFVLLAHVSLAASRTIFRRLLFF